MRQLAWRRSSGCSVAQLHQYLFQKQGCRKYYYFNRYYFYIHGSQVVFKFGACPPRLTVSLSFRLVVSFNLVLDSDEECLSLSPSLPPQPEPTTKALLGINKPRREHHIMILNCHKDSVTHNVLMHVQKNKAEPAAAHQTETRCHQRYVRSLWARVGLGLG